MKYSGSTATDLNINLLPFVKQKPKYMYCFWESLYIICAVCFNYGYLLEK